MRRRHDPLLQQIAWLQRMVRGFHNYHAIPGNMPALETFRREILRYWLHALRRRSQRRSLTWERFGPLTDRCIPKPRILHPHPIGVARKGSTSSFGNPVGFLGFLADLPLASG